MNGVDGHYHLRGIEPGHVLGQVVLVLTEQSENISSNTVVHDKILEGGGREEGGRREGGGRGGCERGREGERGRERENMGGREAGKEGGRKEGGRERRRGREKDLKDRKQKEERQRGMHTHTL